jgi:putative RNA 2'-phosphotransferase
MSKTSDPHTQTSKFLSLVLRHRPEQIGIALDPHGWVDVDALLDACARHGRPISRELLDEIVATSDKQRFAFNDDGRQIRANQGHSVEVDLELAPVEPPEVLYQGTVARFLPSIRREGLRRMKRHHVHLSDSRETALAVGRRRGEPVLLAIESGRMHRDGHAFYLAANGVWLTDAVPPEYLVFPRDM